MIDKFDRKILLALRENGRASNADIARKLHLSISTVVKRKEKLLTHNKITIKAVKNPYKLGLRFHAFIALDTDLTKAENVCSEFVNHPNVSFIGTYFGRFDVMMIVDFADWEFLDDFVKNHLRQVDGVHNIEVFLVSEIKKRYKELFDIPVDDEPAKIDKLDEKLIEELQIDGRATYDTLAQKLGIGIATVSRRINSLIRENIIKITAVPNPSIMGQMANATIHLNVDFRKIDSICDTLITQKPVHLVMTMMNGFQVLVGAEGSSPEILYKFITEKIAGMDGVNDIETTIRAEIKKSDYARLIFDEIQ